MNEPDPLLNPLFSLMSSVVVWSCPALQELNGAPDNEDWNDGAVDPGEHSSKLAWILGTNRVSVEIDGNPERWKKDDKLADAHVHLGFFTC